MKASATAPRGRSRRAPPYTGPWLVVGLVALASCDRRSSATPSSGDLAEQLAREIAIQLSLPSLTSYALGVAAVIGVLTGLRVLLALLWRVGLDPRRQAAALIPLARIAVLFAFVGWVVTRWSRTSPNLLVVVSPIVAAGALWMAVGSARSLAAGLMLSLSRRVRRGDRIRLGEVAGIVRDVGLFRSVVGQSDGSRVYVPNHRLTSDLLVVEPERNTEPVVLRIPLAGADPSVLERRALSHAALSPYRALGTQPDTRLSDDGQVLVVRLHAFNAAAARLAAHTLELALRKDVQDGAAVPQALARLPSASVGD